MPTSGSMCKPRAMPSDRRFWATISSDTSPIITTSGFPPARSIRRSDWKPTEVKKTSMQRSLTVPSKENRQPKATCRSRKSSETARPPVTGAGMHIRPSAGSLRVKNTPSRRAITPAPAVVYISSAITSMPFCRYLIKLLPAFLSAVPIRSPSRGPFSLQCSRQKYGFCPSTPNVRRDVMPDPPRPYPGRDPCGCQVTLFPLPDTNPTTRHALPARKHRRIPTSARRGR